MKEIKRILKLMKNLFRTKCQKCGKGFLNQDDIYITKRGVEINVYTCDKCNNKFI